MWSSVWLRRRLRRYSLVRRSRSCATHNSASTSAPAGPVWSCTTSRSRRASMGDALQQVCNSAGLQPLTYSKAVRLGKPPADAGAGQQARPRPVLVKFGAAQQKHELLQQSKALRGQKVYLMMISPHTSVPCLQSSVACSACSSSTRGLVSGGRSAFSPCMRGGWCHVICALCLQAVAVLQRRREYSAQDRCMGQRQLRGSICLLQTSLLHLMPG